MGDILKPKLAATNENPIVGEPDPKLVEGLEMLLAEAKVGKLIAAASVFVNDEYEPVTAWVNNSGCIHELISGLTLLIRRLQDNLESIEGVRDGDE